MKVLLVTHPFSPDVGGIERMSELLARHFALSGHNVCVVTRSKEADDDAEEWCFAVERNPGARRLVKLHRSADIVFHNNICLRFLWPQIGSRRPLVVAMHGFLRRSDGSMSIRDRLKRTVLRSVTTISISKAVANDLQSASIVIPNGFRDDLFYCSVSPEFRPREFIFVGRLVSQKGADLAVEALAALVEAGHDTALTVVGDGPERAALSALTDSLGVADRVRFAGSLGPEEVREAFNRHRFVLIPSRLNEAFGVVALEAIACGCVPIASASGGLGEAVGDAGLLVPRDDLPALVAAASTLLEDDGLCTRLREEGHRVAEAHRAEVMADAYLGVLEETVNRRNARPSLSQRLRR